MAGKLAVHEAESQAKFEALNAKILGIESRLAAPQTAGPSTSSSSSGPAPSPTTFPRSTIAAPRPLQFDDNCMVFIRGFPDVMPRVVLQEFADEVIQYIPSADRPTLKTRIPVADTQFTLIFTTNEKAKSFIEAFKAAGIYYEDDEDKSQSPLTASLGKPLAIRRRGAAIRPVYAKLEELIPSIAVNATIVQKNQVKNGIMSTEFFLQCGRRLSAAFTLFFDEGPLNTVISKVEFAAASPLSTAGRSAITETAKPQ
jgi:hypothetical protein